MACKLNLADGRLRLSFCRLLPPDYNCKLKLELPQHPQIGIGAPPTPPNWHWREPPPASLQFQFAHSHEAIWQISFIITSIFLKYFLMQKIKKKLRPAVQLNTVSGCGLQLAANFELLVERFVLRYLITMERNNWVSLKLMRCMK